MSDTYYTQQNEERFTFPQNKLYDRHQADYDYNGDIDSDGDSADYYRPGYALKYAVRVG